MTPVFPINQMSFALTINRLLYRSSRGRLVATRVGLALGFVLCWVGITHSAVIDFTTNPAVGFNNTSQLWSSGSVIDAAHFGNDAEADVTANGITFISRGTSSPHFSIPTAGANFASSGLYTPATHTAGFTDIVGMSASDENLMFQSVVFGSGVGNSLVRLNNLTVGQDYVMQLLLVNDDGPAAGTNASVYYSNVTAPPFFGPLDWADDRVWLVTGAFRADAATQDFRVYSAGSDNVVLNAYLLTAVPEAPSLSIFGLVSLLALGYAWAKRRKVR